MKPFFMVYGMGQGAPTARHDSFSRAKAEAERLARNNPGIEFYVLATVGCARKTDVEFTPLNTDDLVPF